jgi:hypothetical protein
MSAERMVDEPVKRKRKVNGWRLVVFALVTGTLLIVIFWIRSIQTSRSDAALCRKVDKLDAAIIAFVSTQKAPKPGEYGYAYWTDHHKTEPTGAPGGKPPKELVSLLRQAACDVHNLPSQGGRP